eukprot:CAMPEP_0196595542 /NCGR_PEP_ID=MMETSP1081-20130531/81341_1 /TAXON_ID=36882 /ORGANISM="Pyramimonas amylifera, Strain CCMP720" /LENGTH=692 /DNA_ID=CAMNT_0041920151 /DNA_START=111 /DNA_END=2189 /DNA_ORIENTATION=+
MIGMNMVPSTLPKSELVASANSSFARGACHPTSILRSGRPQSSAFQRLDTRIKCVATPSKPPTHHSANRSAVEIIKENSDYLRHPLMGELVSDNTFIDEAAMQLMKFHGSYQQDEREKRSFGKGKSYQFMMRTRQPAGVVCNQLYLTMDDLADKYGNGTLRLTTRQAYQLHGILKGDLKTVFSSVIKNMGSTLGACGDVNRNVMGPPAPFKNKPEYVIAEKLANDIADLLAPQSGAYYDVWLDGEKFFSSVRENPEVTAAREDNRFGTNFEGSPEPIYGQQFLPRKFKVGVTVPGDNNIDLYTNDVGIVVITDAAGGFQGANFIVGGGMGRTHRNQDTSPFLGVDIGYVPKEDIFYALKAIVATQRDYGRRDDRKQSRMKYLVHRWGIDKFRSVVEQYYGKKFEQSKPLPPWEFKTYHGWFDQGDGKLAYGIPVMNGRLKGALKQSLRTIIERYELPVRITGTQDLMLCDIDPSWKDDVLGTLRGAGVPDSDQVPLLQARSMACPAMPLCGLAIGEAERGLPEVLERIAEVMSKCGLPANGTSMCPPPVVRMTGCPNGCARPYMAELGFVCDGPGSYQLYLGACPNQTRMSSVFLEKMKLTDMESVLEPLFHFYRARRASEAEAFGDFCNRVGFEALRQFQEVYVAPPTLSRLPRVMVDEDAFALLKATAEKEGKTLQETASDAIRFYSTRQ